MNLSRRGFFKAAGAAFATSMAFELSSKSETLAVEPSADWKLVNTEEYTNICCYCSGGCGVICSTRDGELVNIEGDPDHPINEGGLCPKGATMFQLRNVVDPETREIIKNTNRKTRPMVRRPGASEWEDITWDDAVAEIAQWVKKTRDETFETMHDGITVNPVSYTHLDVYKRQGSCRSPRATASRPRHPRRSLLPRARRARRAAGAAMPCSWARTTWARATASSGTTS